MQSLSPQDKKRVILSVILLFALAITAAILAWTGYLTPVLSKLWTAFQNKEQLREYLKSWGAWAPAAFMFIQMFQVVLAPIPGELTGAVGGFFFDALPTVVYSTVGLTVGSIIAFLAARIIGLPLVKLVISGSTLDKFRFVTESHGTLVILLLFIIPGFPKDILSYLLGLSPMGFARFVTVCTIGRIPGTVMLSFSGAALFHENWTLFAVLAALCGVLLVIFFLFRDRIEHRIKGERRETP